MRQYDTKLVNKVFDIKEKLNDEDKAIIEEMMSNYNEYYMGYFENKTAINDYAKLCERFKKIARENKTLKRNTNKQDSKIKALEDKIKTLEAEKTELQEYIDTTFVI